MVFAGTALPLSSFEILAQSPDLQLTTGTVVEFTLEVDNSTNRTELAYCSSHRSYFIEKPKDSTSRVIISNNHDPSLPNMRDILSVLSHQPPVFGEERASVKYNNVPTKGTTGGGSQRLRDYGLGEEIEISAQGNLVTAMIDGKHYSVSEGESLQENISVSIQSSGMNSDTNATVMLSNHGPINIISHPTQRLFPHTERTEIVVDRLSKSGVNRIDRDEGGVEVTAHQDQDVLGVKVNRGGL